MGEKQMILKEDTKLKLDDSEITDIINEYEKELYDLLNIEKK